MVPNARAKLLPQGHASERFWFSCRLSHVASQDHSTTRLGHGFKDEAPFCHFVANRGHSLLVLPHNTQLH